MAICVGYFERDAETEQPSAVTVAGLVAPKSRWGYFDTRWPRALRDRSLSALDRAELQRLAKLTDEHVLCGAACTLSLDDYEAMNQHHQLAEAVSGPYGICAAVIVARVQQWMARHHPEHLTLFVFEEGHIDHREVLRVLSAEGIDRGEPIQIWPRQWTDERGRKRLLRPFEACDLLAPSNDSGLLDRLATRSAWEHITLGRQHLSILCDALAVPSREQPYVS
jgi:hypothetical protein